MCGKFTQMYSWREVHAFSQPLIVAEDPGQIVTSTPMRFANVLRLNENGEREVTAMRWGFADQKAANPARPKHMHARSETISTRPTFAHAFAQARGVLLVKTFNEGEELPNGKIKQWTITPKDNAPIAIAVICEQWSNENETLWTFVMVTTPPNPLIARVTDRMPAILRADDWPVWLGETGAPLDRVQAVLKTYDDAGAWEIAPQAPIAKAPKPVQGDLL